MLAREIKVLRDIMAYMKTTFDKILNEMNSVEELIVELMTITGAIVRVNDFFVLLVDPESRTDLVQGYYFSQKHFEEKDPSKFVVLESDLNLTLIRRVIILGVPLTCMQPVSDTALDELNKHICIPIKDIINDMYGMVYVTTHNLDENEDNETTRLLTVFADLIGSGSYHLSILKKVFPSYEITSEMLAYHMCPKKELLLQSQQTLKKFQKKKLPKEFRGLRFDNWSLTLEKSLGLVYMGFKVLFMIFNFVY